MTMLFCIAESEIKVIHIHTFIQIIVILKILSKIVTGQIPLQLVVVG